MHGTDGKVFDRIDLVWRAPEEMAEVREIREELSFLRRASQGHLAAPMLIRDSMDPVKSMLDGKMYDSKRALRKTYREGGVEEVGDDPSYTDPEKIRPKRDLRTRDDKRRDADALTGAIERGLSKANLTTSSPGDHVEIRDWTPRAGPERFHGMK